MEIVPKAVSRLIESFERLPGIGPKTAQRLVFYLLHVPQGDLDKFGDYLKSLKTSTVLCSVCRNIADNDPCVICENPARDTEIVCVVEQPTDVLSLERTGKFRGRYHVLHGHIDPLNNIGPDELYITDLLKRIEAPDSRISEVLLATNPNMEGEATAMYIQKQVELHSNGRQIACSRLAHGLPVGGDLEYADEVTLSRAIEGRRTY